MVLLDKEQHAGFDGRMYLIFAAYFSWQSQLANSALLSAKDPP
jgi:hypothetical protein